MKCAGSEDPLVRAMRAWMLQSVKFARTVDPGRAVSPFGLQALYINGGCSRSVEIELRLMVKGGTMHVVSAPVLEGWTALSDERVVGRVLAGQTALFEVLMRRHNERLYRTPRAILTDESEAEDVMQQAYVNAYSHLRQFDGRFATFPVTDRVQLRHVLVGIGSERDERGLR